MDLPPLLDQYLVYHLIRASAAILVLLRYRDDR